MQFLIIDKNPATARLLNDLLAGLFPSALIRTYHEAASLYPLLQLFVPDVLFIDVELPARSGFELVAELPAPPFRIIYTAANEEHAVKAFKFRADHYLTKPYSAEALADAFRTLAIKHH